MAIIAGEGERAVSAEVLAVVEARLSQAGVALVEREQLRRVLQEHALSASSLQRAGERLKLGTLTAADLFLTVNSVPAATNKLWRVHLVEVRTGVALNGMTVAETSVATNTASLADLVRLASARLATPHEARRYVGIAGFRSEELNRSLDGLAESLGGILPLKLGDSPRVVVLDRENLVAIASEDALTEADVDLRPATTWIEGFLRRLPDEGKLRVTLLFHPLPAGGPRRVTLTVPESWSEASRAVTQAILDELKLTPTATVNSDRKAEAARFAERAAILSSNRAREPAARAMDAALVLAPSDEYRLKAAHYWNEADVYLNNVYDLAREGKSTAPASYPPLEIKLRHLAMRLRASELFLEALRGHVTLHERNPRALAQPPRITGNTLRSVERLSPEDLPAEALERRRELCRIHLEIYRATKKCYEANWDEPEGRNSPGFQAHPQGRWCRLVGDMLPRLPDWANNVDEWMGLTREIIRDLKGRNFDAVDRTLMLPWQGLVGNAGSQFPEAKPRVIEFHETLAHDSEAAVRFVALYNLQWLTKTTHTDRDPVACRRFLDEFVRSMPVDHPVRVKTKDNFFPSIAVHDVMANTIWGKGDYVSTDKYARAIFDPIFAGGHAERLPAWQSLAREWLEHLPSNTNANYALGIVEQFMDLQTSLPASQGQGEEFARYIRSLHERLTGSAASAEGAWNEYEFKPVGLQGMSPGFRLRGVAELAGQLYLALGAPTNHPHMIVELARVPLSGGPVTPLGRTTIKADFWALNDAKAVPLLRVVPDTNAVYVFNHDVHRRGVGVAVFRRNRFLTSEDTNAFPVAEVKNIAVLHGRGYFGLDGALIEYRPENDSWRELISSRAAANPRHVLDGGTQFGLSGPLADEQRHCLWFTVGEGDWLNPTLRSGLWRYSLSSGRIEKASDLRMRLQSWQAGQMLARLDFGSALVSIDPDSLKLTPLVSNSRTNASGAPRFALRNMGYDQQFVWLNDHLITSDPTLELWTTNATVPVRKRLGAGPGRELSVQSLELLSDGRLLLFTGEGDLWLIRRKKTESNQISRP